MLEVIVGNYRQVVAQKLKCLPGMWETLVQSLGWEDSLEKAMAPQSSILAWKIPRAEQPGGYNPWGPKQLSMTEQLSTPC